MHLGDMFDVSSIDLQCRKSIFFFFFLMCKKVYQNILTVVIMHLSSYLVNVGL